MKPNIIFVFAVCLQIIFGSCSEEIGPCYEYEVQCNVLIQKMNQSITDAEKEQYRQLYLAEKHLLEYCNSQNK